MKNVTSSTTAKKVDLVSLIGFLEYYLPIIDFLTPTKINQGGCGFFAMQLYRVLKSMGVECEIAYAVSTDDVNEMNYLKGNNAIPSNKPRLGIFHSVVNLTPYIAVDSNGVTKPLSLMEAVKKDCQSGVISEEQMQVLWDNVPSWNVVFDRDCCDALAKLIAEIPAKYERFLVEGYIDLPNQNKSVKMTKKTVDAMQRQNPLVGLGALLAGLHNDSNQ